MSDHKIRVVYTRHDLAEMREFLMACTLIANDIETLPSLALISVNGYSGLLPSGEERSYVVPFYKSRTNESGPTDVLESAMHVMREVNASGIPFTYHNGAYDLFYLLRYHLPVANYAFDSMTMFWSWLPELPKTLAFVSSIMLDDYQYWKGDGKSTDYLTYLRYNGKDCIRTLNNTIALIKVLSGDPRVLRNFVSAHSRILLALGMSLRGMRVDMEVLEKHGEKLYALAESKLSELRYLLADADFNPNSPKQKSELLYGLLGASPRSAKGRKVKTIAEGSTGATVLRAIRSEHPLFRRVANGILEAIEPSKQISNVLGIRLASWQGADAPRFYTSYNGVGTITSRMSASETPIKVGTNAQNIRKTYRDFIRADPDSFLLDIDLTAGDDVFVTFESADPEKIKLFRSGLDSHCQNATLFFPNWTYEQVARGKAAHDPRVVHPITGIRQITKKLSHGCNYLMAALTLLMTAGREAIVAAAKEVGHADAGLWNQDKLVAFCQQEEMLYRNHYVRFRRSGPGSWYMELRDEAIRTGGFTTPFNYFERFLGDPRDDGVVRGLAASAGQAGTAGRINMAVEELVHGIIPLRFRDAPNPHADREPLRVAERLNGTSLRLQTHDSLTFNISRRHPRWREGVERIFTVMSRPVVIRNTLTGGLEEFVVGTETDVGLRWGEGLKAVKSNTVEAVELALQ